MKLNIFPEQRLGVLQAAFSAQFPALKLIFFRQKHEAFQGSAAKLMITDESLPLAALSEKIDRSYLLLEPEMPVWQVERRFEQGYGLHVQVFRRSGNSWLETSATDNLSLEQQEAMGQASVQLSYEQAEPLDYREQD